MKRSFCFIFILLVILASINELLAQSPHAINYQAIARDTNGVIITNQNINLKTSIISDSIQGQTVYEETHFAITNDFGLFNIAIGKGQAQIGDFKAINWGASKHFIKTEIDFTGGQNFLFMGISQLLSVPYALHASSLSLTDENGNVYDITVDTTGNLVTRIKTWTCGNPFTDNRDGNVYSTKKIGNQCWMTENLNIGLMINGIEEQYDNGVIEKYCYLDNPSNCDNNGGLYQWDEMMQYVHDTAIQGICPDGWIIPSDADWKILEGIVDSQYGVGDPVWDGLGWRGDDAGTNLKQGGSSGFEAMLAGNRNNDGTFSNLGFYANIWASAEINMTDTWYRSLGVSFPNVYRASFAKAYGFSVRCMQNLGPPAPQPCPGIPTINYGGQIYNTVQIGSQCWMKENLNIGYMVDGAYDQIDDGMIEKYCYDDNPGNCDTYGGLYQWDEMMNYITIEGTRGICPAGWHIPTDAEWTTLTDYLGGGGIAGGKMKAVGTNYWNTPNTDASNESGFTALGSGQRLDYGAFYYIGDYTDFWSSTESNYDNALYRLLYYDWAGVSDYDNLKNNGFSVRCMKD